MGCGPFFDMISIPGDVKTMLIQRCSRCYAFWLRNGNNNGFLILLLLLLLLLFILLFSHHALLLLFSLMMFPVRGRPQSALRFIYA